MIMMRARCSGGTQQGMNKEGNILYLAVNVALEEIQLDSDQE
jgi:hypothetical protein